MRLSSKIIPFHNDDGDDNNNNNNTRSSIACLTCMSGHALQKGIG